MENKLIEKNSAPVEKLSLVKINQKRQEDNSTCLYANY
jgi:hypothetical protein